ncbi:alpha/beta fold hydrolase [Pedococcus sp. P5_B7]
MSSDDAAHGVSELTLWEQVGGTRLRIRRFTPRPVGRAADALNDPNDPSQSGLAVLVPGLGLPRYLLPLARHLAAEGLETVLLDALAWRGRGAGSGRAERAVPTIAGLSELTAAWLRRQEAGPVVVVGHSTGAQVALEAVLRVQRTRPGLALVMGGPTFTPDQRRLRWLVPAALTSYLKDPPRELVVLKDVARVRTDLARIVQSARRHPTDKRVGLLTVPLTVTAGLADSFAPRDWLDLLASRAGASSHRAVLPGSHNNPFTYPELFGALVVEALARARRPGREDLVR